MAKKRILIVEDERPLARALQLKLEHEGHNVSVTHDGNSALSLLSNESFDIVLLDIMMPTIDGFQVLESLQGKSPAPYTIVLSNLSQPDDEQKAMQLGAKKFFVKSNTPLATIVDEIGTL